MKKFLCYDTNDAASGKINVDNRGILKPNSTVPSGSAPYQQLVTDGTGAAKWEDRLAYEGSRVVIDGGDGARLVKVSDEIPSWASVDAPIKIWLSNGTNGTENPESYINLGNGSFVCYWIYFITTDNFESHGTVFPEKGVYFVETTGGVCAIGIASADSDTPEITWDGNIGEIKKIDPKYIPDDRFVVTFTESEDGNITPDKTFSEIFDACKAGRKVSGVVLHAPNDWHELYVSTVNGDEIEFFMMAGTTDGCQYAVVHVSRTGGTSLISGLLTQK